MMLAVRPVQFQRYILSIRAPFLHSLLTYQGCGSDTPISLTGASVSLHPSHLPELWFLRSLLLTRASIPSISYPFTTILILAFPIFLTPFNSLSPHYRILFWLNRTPVSTLSLSWWWSHSLYSLYLYLTVKFIIGESKPQVLCKLFRQDLRFVLCWFWASRCILFTYTKAWPEKRFEIIATSCDFSKYIK